MLVASETPEMMYGTSELKKLLPRRTDTDRNKAGSSVIGSANAKHLLWNEGKLLIIIIGIMNNSSMEGSEKDAVRLSSGANCQNASSAMSPWSAHMRLRIYPLKDFHNVRAASQLIKQIR